MQYLARSSEQGPERDHARARRARRLLGRLGLAWVWAGAACAQLQVEPEPVEHPTTPLSVDDAVALALRNHPDVRIARQHLLQAAADVDESASAFWPDVSVAARFTRTDTPSRVFAQLLDQGEFTSAIDFNDPGTHSNFRPEALGRVTLYDGGRRRARLSASEARLGASVAFERELRGLIAFETASAWYRVHAARAAAAAAAREVPVLQQLLETAEAEFESGAALPLAVQELRLQLSQAQHGARTAQATARRARSALVLLLGLSVEETVELHGPGVLPDPPLEPLDGLLERARFERPELVGAQHDIEAALASLREAEAGYLPKLGVSAAFGFNDERARLARSNWLFGIGLVESLTEALRTPHRARRAAAALLVAHEAGRRSLLAVEGEVEAAWLDAQEAQWALALARQERARAETTLRRVEAEREVGAARAVALAWARLTAERAATQAHIRALRGAQAQVALAHAVGTFPAPGSDPGQEQP